MEAIIGLIIMIVLFRLGIQVLQWMWSKNIPQTIFKKVCISMLTGGIILAATGDPSFGAGGGITLALISIAVGGE